MSVISADQRRLPLQGTEAELSTLRDVVAASLALGAVGFGGPLSRAEHALVERVSGCDLDVEELKAAIRTHQDPLGEAICRACSARERRKSGAFYTPRPLVAAMTAWALDQSPSRVIDAGCGSGRFAAEAASDTDLEIIAVDIDPVATLACRATLCVLGGRHVRVINADYTKLTLAPSQGRTAFIGNPPYVRHHDLTPGQKDWIKETACKLGLDGSGLGLAGLHVHFFLATALHAREGDVGCFITSAEWLDVGYGKVLRSALLKGLGGLSVHLIDPKFLTFQDAMTTAVITCFEKGAHPTSVRITTVMDPNRIPVLGESGRRVASSRLAKASRWSPIVTGTRRTSTPGTIRLGDLVRVSRGCVTGANRFFVLTRAAAAPLGLGAYAVPVLSSAEEVFVSEGVVRSDDSRKLLLDPPRTINLRRAEHSALRRYLDTGEELGVSQGYICRHRNPWWHVGSKRPPVVATYMARQPPAFALNPDGMAMINVLHGLFPLEPLDEEQLLGLVLYLNANRASFRGAGRMYQGGLEKFEPSEMEAIEVRPPEELGAYAHA